MTQILLAIAGYAVFTGVLLIIERLHDRRAEAGRSVPPPASPHSPVESLDTRPTPERTPQHV